MCGPPRGGGVKKISPKPPHSHTPYFLGVFGIFGQKRQKIIRPKNGPKMALKWSKMAKIAQKSAKSSRGFSPETSTLGVGTLNPPLTSDFCVEKGRASFRCSLAPSPLPVPPSAPLASERPDPPLPNPLIWGHPPLRGWIRPFQIRCSGGTPPLRGRIRPFQIRCRGFRDTL